MSTNFQKIGIILQKKIENPGVLLYNMNVVFILSECASIREKR
jgi:hypothetical protein